MSIFCLVFSLYVGLVFSENSPALLWSPERSMVNFPDVSSVDSFTASDFFDQYLSPLMKAGKENAVVFLQDKLSVDDFTNYADVYSFDSSGGSFKNVKRLMEDHFSLEIPEVDSPHKAVEKLEASFDGNVHVIDGLSQLESLQLGAGNRFLLIVNLRPVIGSGDIEKAISQNDALVGDVAKHFQSKDIHYSALFTGKSAQQSDERSSQISDSTEHSNRHLLATKVDASDRCAFMNVSDNSVFVFLCGFSVCIKDTSDKRECAFKLNTTVTENVAGSSSHSNNTGTVILKFDKLKDTSGNEYAVDVVFEVSLRQDRWAMDRIYLNLSQTVGGSAENKTDIFNATLINYSLDTVIPRLYSFHCSRLRLFVETVKDTTHKQYAGSSVTLEGFQFQVFDITHDRFFHAQDCVGFFTRGIWMGIVPGLLLLGILIYGTMMILNLSVMDKFDDPKGKTISVSIDE